MRTGGVEGLHALLVYPSLAATGKTDDGDSVRPDSNTPPKYNLMIVESAVLEIAAELHPEHLSAAELSLRIVSDTDDEREVETAAQAIRNLGDLGLLCYPDDEIVEPTPAALRAVALLT
jgi:hypothetical protein